MHSSSREARLTPDPEVVARQAHIGPAESSLERGIEAATAALVKQQRADGHWVFELEADVTIAAEDVVLRRVGLAQEVLQYDVLRRVGLAQEVLQYHRLRRHHCGGGR